LRRLEHIAAPALIAVIVDLINIRSLYADAPKANAGQRRRTLTTRVVSDLQDSCRHSFAIPLPCYRKLNKQRYTLDSSFRPVGFHASRMTAWFHGNQHEQATCCNAQTIGTIARTVNRQFSSEFSSQFRRRARQTPCKQKRTMKMILLNDIPTDEEELGR